MCFACCLSKGFTPFKMYFADSVLWFMQCYHRRNNTLICWITHFVFVCTLYICVTSYCHSELSHSFLPDWQPWENCFSPTLQQFWQQHGGFWGQVTSLSARWGWPGWSFSSFPCSWRTVESSPGQDSALPAHWSLWGRTDRLTVRRRTETNYQGTEAQY